MLQRFVLVIAGIILGILAGYQWFTYGAAAPASLSATTRSGNVNPGQRERYTIVTFDLPETLTFAGEPIPMQYPDVRERLDRELHTNTYWNTSTVFILKRANRWFPQIEPILEEQDIPEDFKYLAVIESTLQNVVSPSNAVGFWQLLEGTARENGLEVNSEVDERYDPVKSTYAACKYLRKAYKEYGNWTTAAASYNAGVTGINRQRDRQGVDHYYDLLLNEETERYVFRILAIKQIMENPETYGYFIPEKHLYQPEELKSVTVKYNIEDLSLFAAENNLNYKLLKRYNPWLRSNTLTIKRPGSTYELLLPEYGIN